MVSRSFFDAHPREFFDFYFSRMLFLDAQPNQAHRKLAELEREGTLSAVITQNVDGLHQMAGSRNVFELHGSSLRNHCIRCRAAYALEEMVAAHERSDDGVPRCDCGGVIRPDVVLYEEALDTGVMEAAVRAVTQADLLIVGGTSLVVWPAAGLIRYFSGDSLVLINKGETPYDDRADLLIRAPIAKTLGKIAVR